MEAIDGLVNTTCDTTLACIDVNSIFPSSSVLSISLNSIGTRFQLILGKPTNITKNVKSNICEMLVLQDFSADSGKT